MFLDFQAHCLDWIQITCVIQTECFNFCAIEITGGMFFRRETLCHRMHIDDREQETSFQKKLS